MRRSLVRHLMLGGAAIFVALAAGAAEEKSLLTNGGFEKVTQVAGVAEGSGKHGSWMLKGGPHTPARWTPSHHFSGELSILSEGAPEGKQFLRIQAGAKREAHIVQPCPGVKSDSCYMVSIRYRGGPVRVKAYEYSGKGGGPYIETIAEGQAIAYDGGWRRIEHSYYPSGIAKVSIVAAVAAGCVAEIDDFRVWQVQPETSPDAGGWLNVRECGASGSALETVATTTAGSREITVKNVGDFKPGQGIMISKCHPHYTNCFLRGPRSYYRNAKPIAGVVELRGFDGSAGDWLVFILDIDGDQPLTFRWSDDLARSWQANRVPITWDWQKLSGGLEVRFLKRDLELGHGITFSARTQLVTTVEKVDGNSLRLRDAPTKNVTNAVVRHCEAAALQATIDRAIRERRNVYFPNGYYRLERGLDVRNATIRIEGASGVNTVMDITDGEGAVFALSRGEEVTIRNFRMVGHGGCDNRAGTMTTGTGAPFWAMSLKRCRAVFIRSTERVLIENVHASQMANECFYSQASCRTGENTPKHYTKSLTFLRCSVTDCGFNAFNNNDIGENTSVLYCRVQDIGSYAYEGPGKFVRCIGNYVRNAKGGFVIGNYEARSEHLHKLGCGQAVIRDNVLEGTFPGRAGVAVTRGARQVTIANNLFVNFNGTAIRAADSQMHKGYPARNIIITGNIVDLTHNGEKPRRRTGIEVYSSDVTVANNQIYVRGSVDQRVSGIWIKDPAVNITVHDNLVRNCAYGIRTSRVRAKVEEVIDPVTFLQKGLPMGWRTSHLYRGWGLAWLTGDNVNGMSTLDSYDPESMRFKLTKAHDMKVGDLFEVFPAHSANWNIHDNTITGCAQPVVLDSYGSDTSLFKNNTVTRGEATGVKQAVVVSGRFRLIGNQVAGFDEEGCSPLLLNADKAGRAYRNVICGNYFEKCATAVRESKQGLWDGALRNGNVFLDCGNAEPANAGDSPEQGITAVLIAITPPKKPEFDAPRLKAETKLDGDVSEWPWEDTARVAVLRRGPAGDPVSSPRGYACAAHDDDNLYLAMRFELPKGAKLQAKGGFDRGDGIEVSFQNAAPKHTTPIFLLWGSVGGTHASSPAMGASADQVERLRKGTSYAARKTDTGWACEWRIPFSPMGLDADNVKTLFFNLGLQCTANGSWIAWTPTGGRVCDVANAGKLHLRRPGE